MKLSYTTFNDTFLAKELLFSDYKNFLKSFYGEDVNLTEFLFHFLELFSKISDKSIEYFQELTMPEIFLLLVQLRIYTLGSSCGISVKVQKEEKEEKVSVTLNLERIKQDLLDFVALNYPCSVSDDTIELELSFPSLSRLTMNDDVESYITNCKVENKALTKITNEQAFLLFSKLSAKTSALIFSKKETLVNSLKRLNFLAPYEGISEYYLNFDLTLQSFLWYCKLFFNETLESLFENLFYLSYIGKFNLDYIENSCTPGEYIYFIKKLNATINDKRENSQTIQ